jgi:hypothetical protein
MGNADGRVGGRLAWIPLGYVVLPRDRVDEVSVNANTEWCVVAL